MPKSGDRNNTDRNKKSIQRQIGLQALRYFRAPVSGLYGVRSMTNTEVVNTLSYLYLKKELENLAEQREFTKEERKRLEKSLKIKLNIGKELCWI